MKTSLFSQSLFALPLYEAVRATKEAGFSAIELACAPPHLDLKTARNEPERVAQEIREAGLTVSALSLFNERITDPDGIDAEIESAETYIRLAPYFCTRVVKLTPGRPGSAEATQQDWQVFVNALERLIPIAKENHVRLAVETHMRQLTDTLASSRRLLDTIPDETLGLTVDFLNLAFAGESMQEVVRVLGGRMCHTHVKNGYKDADGGWHFQALDEGILEYREVLALLCNAGYEGYLSIECLSPLAKTQPVETARNDFNILKRYLADIGLSS